MPVDLWFCIDGACFLYALHIKMVNSEWNYGVYTATHTHQTYIDADLQGWGLVNFFRRYFLVNSRLSIPYNVFTDIPKMSSCICSVCVCDCVHIIFLHFSIYSYGNVKNKKIIARNKVFLGCVKNVYSYGVQICC